MLERLKTDILILGSGGAGLFAALHAHQANPALDITVATKGLLGKCGCTRMVQGGYNVALNPGQLGRAPFHGHHRGWQVAAPPAARLDAGGEGGRARAGARERDRLLLRPQPRRHAARQGLRRPDLRPHRAQGRPHGHRDRQPADGAGVGAARAAAGGAPRGRAHPGEGRPVAVGRAAHRHPHRPLPLRRGAAPCCWRPAADRPCTATTRPPATRAWTGLPWRCAWGCRCATWRWCSSTPRACWRDPTRA